MTDIISSIGRYQVIRPLGHGAMGTVFLAEDPMLKRRLAIKVVRATGEEREIALERFKREAEISAQLNHPNIVTVYDVGEEPNIGPFLAMELVEGHSLGRLIREDSLDLETKLSILIQAMRALRSAHRHAIIHRDVKPDNIQVAEDGRVKLMDFGIAKTMAPPLFGRGEFLGSPAYAAPELLKGQEPTPSSDRYAFAATAFELLSGCLPHPGNNVAAVISHVLHESIVIPPGMSAPMANVFRKAMAPDPENRHENLMEFLTGLMDTAILDEGARFKVEELFHHDDHAGDIVPIRRKRSRKMEQNEAWPAAPRPNPILPPTASQNIKIELEPGNLPQPARITTAPIPRPNPKASEGVRASTWIKWLLVLLIFVPLLAWGVDFFISRKP